MALVYGLLGWWRVYSIEGTGATIVFAVLIMVMLLFVFEGEVVLVSLFESVGLDLVNEVDYLVYVHVVLEDLDKQVNFRGRELGVFERRRLGVVMGVMSMERWTRRTLTHRII